MISFEEALDKVLTSPKYNILTGRTPDLKEVALDVLSSFYQNFIEPILRLIKLPKVNVPFTSPNLLSNIFIVVGVIISIIIIYLSIKYIHKRRKQGNGINEIFAELANKTTTYEKLLEEAKNLGEMGDYRNAIRLEYIALLWVFHKNSIIFLKDAKTNNQLKREVKHNALHFYPNFTSIVDLFNYTWFGHKIVETENYTHNRNLVLKLIQEVNLHEKSV